MAKASQKKTAQKKKQREITGSFDDVISASVRGVGHKPKQPIKSKKK